MMSNRTWHDIAVTALVGTERQAIASPESAGAIADVIDRIPAGSAESRLLGAAAATSVMLRAGAVAADVAGAQLSEAEPEQLALCSPKAGELLRAIMHENDWPIADRLRLMREWLGLAARAGRIVPPDHLVDVFSAAEKDEPLRNWILSCGERLIGKRGVWLSGQNPKWFFVRNAETDDSATWETGLPEQRLEYLRRVRGKDPAAGRALVEAAWKQENANMRKAFVEILSESLVADDEQFLEAALDDKSKVVRAAVPPILSRLPDSALSRRMSGRVQEFVSVEKKLLGGIKINVVLPEAIDDSMRRDGVDESVESSLLGAKAWMLLKMLALTPLDHWTSDRFTPDDLVAAARKNKDWAFMLVDGWARAASTQRNGKWLLAIWNTLDMHDSRNIHGDLLAPLPAAELGGVTSRLLGSKPSSSAASRLIRIMERDDFAADETTTKSIFDWLKRYLLSGEHVEYIGPQLLQIAAMRCDPHLLDDAREIIRAILDKKPEYEKKTIAFPKIYELRSAMHKEIRP